MKENIEDFLGFIKEIGACKDLKELKNLLEKNKSLIAEYSPLMHESISNLKNLDSEEVKEKCRFVLVPAN